MSFVQNFPFFSIIIAMFSGIVSSVLDGKKARNLSLGMIAVTTALSAGTLIFCLGTGESYTFMMGHFPAPWGNEIRAGILEGVTAVFFGVVMFLAVIGGLKHTAEDVEEKKLNLFYIMIDLMLSSLLALVYTNDLFTAYVFVEINTIAGCGLIMIRQKGRSMSAAIRYMIMSQLGSGLFLIGLSLLYDVTGHLLMSPAKESVNMLVAAGSYRIPMLVIMAVIGVGLAIKSGLYPFHYWIPDTYGYATPTASAVLSGLVSKGYIFGGIRPGNFFISPVELFHHCLYMGKLLTASIYGGPGQLLTGKYIQLTQIPCRFIFHVQGGHQLFDTPSGLPDSILKAAFIPILMSLHGILQIGDGHLIENHHQSALISLGNPERVLLLQFLRHSSYPSFYCNSCKTCAGLSFA